MNEAYENAHPGKKAIGPDTPKINETIEIVPKVKSLEESEAEFVKANQKIEKIGGTAVRLLIL